MIGRKAEQEELLEAFNKDESQFVAVYGRRRVGKTYLIRETFHGKFVFQHTGLANAPLAEQLAEFQRSLQTSGMKKASRPKSWREAFHFLSDMVEKIDGNDKKVIFIDELPWMDTPKSNLLSALEHFWNSWASARKDIVLIVCGSATAWVQKKILNNYGGLHNRVTLQLLVKPFTLGECESYAESLGLSLSREEVAVGYMIMGGIPYYWSLLKKKWSLDQNINHLFFKDGAPLRNEFNALYFSLFKSPEPYMKVVTALATVQQGMQRSDILRIAKLSDNDIFSRVLSDLQLCGFVRRYSAIGKKSRNGFYQLIDNYTLFYLSFITQLNGNSESFWTDTIDTPLRNAWTGLAFERLCLWHIPQIKTALGINGINCSVYSWRTEPNEQHCGAQIDLLIDRNDGVINLCEMKFADSEYALDSTEESKLRNRRSAFRLDTETKKSVHITLVTTYGLRKNSHSGIVQSVVTLNDLFL